MSHLMANCLVTGGAGFIGSHLAERLVQDGHSVRVVDNLSTGLEENLAHLKEDLEFQRGDLRDSDACRKACDGIEIVYHVAALPSVPRSMKRSEEHTSELQSRLHLVCRL